MPRRPSAVRQSLRRTLAIGLLAAVAAATGCSTAEPARVSTDGGLSSGDAVGRTLFNAESRALARGQRPLSGQAVASVQITP